MRNRARYLGRRVHERVSGRRRHPYNGGYQEAKESRETAGGRERGGEDDDRVRRGAAQVGVGRAWSAAACGGACLAVERCRGAVSDDATFCQGLWVRHAAGKARTGGEGGDHREGKGECNERRRKRGQSGKRQG